MSRTVRHRWVLTGTLVAESAVHVGGIGEGPATSLGVARDGQEHPLLPGTSLAGAIRAALDTLDPAMERLWGCAPRRQRRGEDNDSAEDQDPGEASWVWVADATAPADTVPEVRESVGIDRIDGVAARGHLFTREVLPIGTRFGFRLRVDDPLDAEHDGAPSAAERLVRRIAGLLRGSSFTVGAATTRGLGRVRLQDAVLHRFCLHSRAGMIATLRGAGTEITLSDSDDGVLPADVLRVTVPWRPHGPVMVQLAVDGDAVEAFPLTARTTPTAVRLLLPGSSIKGTLRAHAERIVRTVRIPCEVKTPEKFLDQMKAEGLEPVGTLFGTAGEEQTRQARGRRGALTARECLGRVELPAGLWTDVRLLQRRIDDKVTDNGGSEAVRQRTALKRLQHAVAELNTKLKKAAGGVRFTITPHNAVDQWTGGAADSLLFATLEPQAHDLGAWGPIVLDIDTGRLGDRLPATLALLLFLLRDLCDGLIPFGHGTTRGMGAVRVDPTAVTFDAGSAVPLRAALHGRSLAELLSDTELTGQLERAWATAGENPATGIPGDEDQAQTGPPASDPAASDAAHHGAAAQRAPATHSSPAVHSSVSVSAAAATNGFVDRSVSTAQEVLRSFAANVSPDLPVVGFVYNSAAAPWFRLAADGTPRGSDGGVLDLTGAFELCAFDANRELRWWHTGGGRGHARELTDQTIGFPALKRLDRRPYPRLLWGEVTAAEQGWVTLYDARIGSLKVPLSRPAPAGGHVWLQAVEYITEDAHGNVAVVDERLIGLVVEGSGK